MEITFTSHSHQDTLSYGKALGEVLQAGCVIGLIGDLGSGKTCLIKGIAYGMNRCPENEVTSPTFTILQEYSGRIPLYHCDAYRLSDAAELDTIGFEEYIGGDGVLVIEWADRIHDALPKEYLLITIDSVQEDWRRFTCKATGEYHMEILKKFYAEIEKD